MSIESLRPAPPPRPSESEAVPAPREPSRDPGEPSPFARMLHGIGHEVKQGEALMKQALSASRSGRDLGAAELLTLQAGVYRYSEAVDLAAKLVDRATNGVKTVISGQ